MFWELTKVDTSRCLWGLHLESVWKFGLGTSGQTFTLTSPKEAKGVPELFPAFKRLIPLILVVGRLKQEDCCEFQTS